MTYDVVALLDGAPTSEDLLAALAAAGEEWDVRAVSGGEVVQLCDSAGEPVLSIDAPLYLQVAGEAARLLGPEFADLAVPVWWLEVRAVARTGASKVAWRYADAVVGRVGGRVWALPPQAPPPIVAAAATGGRHG